MSTPDELNAHLFAIFFRRDVEAVQKSTIHKIMENKPIHRINRIKA